MPSSDLLAAELLKVRKRWLPWILLAVLLLVMGMHVWLGGFIAWRASDDHRFEQDSLRFFVLPWAMPGLLETVQFWGAILAGILAASVVATEHNWGTVRQALIRGQPRSSYLTAKLAGIATLGLLGFFAALLTGIVLALLATASAAGASVEPALSRPSFLDIVLMVLRALYATAPHVLLAFCLTVVSRSTTMGVAGILVYFIVEGIVVGILGGVGGQAADYRVFFLGHNVVGLLSANRIDGEAAGSFAFRDSPPSIDLPDPAASAVVIGVYCALFLLISYRVFLQRDIVS